MSDKGCEGCPGPEVLKIWHENLMYKISVICDWKKEMEKNLDDYREKREHDEKEYREKREQGEREYKKEIETYREKRQEEEIRYRKEVEGKFSNLKTWAVTTLTAVVMVLLAQIVLMIRQ